MTSDEEDLLLPEITSKEETWNLDSDQQKPPEPADVDTLPETADQEPPNNTAAFQTNLRDPPPTYSGPLRGEDAAYTELDVLDHDERFGYRYRVKRNADDVVWLAVRYEVAGLSHAMSIMEEFSLFTHRIHAAMKLPTVLPYEDIFFSWAGNTASMAVCVIRRELPQTQQNLAQVLHFMRSSSASFSNQALRKLFGQLTWTVCKMHEQNIHTGNMIARNLYLVEKTVGEKGKTDGNNGDDHLVFVDWVPLSLLNEMRFRKVRGFPASHIIPAAAHKYTNNFSRDLWTLATLLLQMLLVGLTTSNPQQQSENKFAKDTLFDPAFLKDDTEIERLIGIAREYENGQWMAFVDFIEAVFASAATGADQNTLLTIVKRFPSVDYWLELSPSLMHDDKKSAQKSEADKQQNYLASVLQELIFVRTMHNAHVQYAGIANKLLAYVSADDGSVQAPLAGEEALTDETLVEFRQAVHESLTNRHLSRFTFQVMIGIVLSLSEKGSYRSRLLTLKYDELIKTVLAKRSVDENMVMQCCIILQYLSNALPNNRHLFHLAQTTTASAADEQCDDAKLFHDLLLLHWKNVDLVQQVLLLFAESTMPLCLSQSNCASNIRFGITPATVAQLLSLIRLYRTEWKRVLRPILLVLTNLCQANLELAHTFMACHTVQLDPQARDYEVERAQGVRILLYGVLRQFDQHAPEYDNFTHSLEGAIAALESYGVDLTTKTSKNNIGQPSAELCALTLEICELFRALATHPGMTLALRAECVDRFLVAYRLRFCNSKKKRPEAEKQAENQLAVYAARAIAAIDRTLKTLGIRVWINGQPSFVITEF